MIPMWYHRSLTVGDTGGDVKIVQRKLMDEVTGLFTQDTAARVRGLQRKVGLPMTGEVDPETAEVLGEAAGSSDAPDWYARDLDLWMEGEDVRALRRLLGMNDRDDRFDPDVEAAVRRFQSSQSLTPTGRVDSDLLVLLSQKNPQ